MENIIEPSTDFDFSKLKLSIPTPYQNNYFSKITFQNHSLYIKCPKSSIKQNISKITKKLSVDFIFDILEIELMTWFEKLEQTCISLIQEQSNLWFEEPLENGDIENAFLPTLKFYKSGKFFLIHVNIKSNIKVFNEDLNELTLEDLNGNTLLSIFEIQGVRFNNKDFSIVIELKQGMIVKPDPFLENCFLKNPSHENQKKLNFVKEVPEIVLGKEEENELEEIPMENLFVEKIPEKEPEKEIVVDNEFQEISLDKLEDLDLGETIELKNPDEVYYTMYKKALEKAKELKKLALDSYLAAQNIKQLYMLEIKEEDFDNL